MVFQKDSLIGVDISKRSVKRLNVPSISYCAPKPCGTVVYMANSLNRDRSNVQDFSEGKLNGGHERSRIMI